MRISGNAAIVDTTLTGKSINGSGVKIDSLPGSSVVTRSVLDNATLNGSSSSGKGVEITSDINGIHHSSINGTTTGTGYGIDIGENSNVTGTSEADLLILQGVATTGTGTGIKLNGNNDLSNTSLNSSAVDGIALDITGPLANQGNVILNGTASGSGIGAQVNGSLSDSVVNGTSTNGIGVQINGSLKTAASTAFRPMAAGLKSMARARWITLRSMATVPRARAWIWRPICPVTMAAWCMATRSMAPASTWVKTSP